MPIAEAVVAVAVAVVVAVVEVAMLRATKLRSHLRISTLAQPMPNSTSRTLHSQPTLVRRLLRFLPTARLLKRRLPRMLVLQDLLRTTRPSRSSTTSPARHASVRRMVVRRPVVQAGAVRNSVRTWKPLGRRVSMVATATTVVEEVVVAAVDVAAAVVEHQDSLLLSKYCRLLPTATVGLRNRPC